ncbi:MAG: hypothetical protein AABW64_03935 [Nanoarchaeota archaeon]
MIQISDRTLIALTVVALLTTIGGTITLLQQLGPNIPQLTGLASTDTATVNVTVSSTVSVKFNVDLIEFGTSQVVSGLAVTQVNTTAGTNPGTFNEPGDFVIENDGNVELNITINGTPAGAWIGGTNPTYRVSARSPGTSDDGCSKNRTNTVPISLNATLLTLCYNFTFVDINDTMNISIYVGIPSDVGAGVKTDSAVTVFATQITTFIG